MKIETDPKKLRYQPAACYWDEMYNVDVYWVETFNNACEDIQHIDNKHLAEWCKDDDFFYQTYKLGAFKREIYKRIKNNEILRYEYDKQMYKYYKICDKWYKKVNKYNPSLKLQKLYLYD